MLSSCCIQFTFAGRNNNNNNGYLEHLTHSLTHSYTHHTHRHTHTHTLTHTHPHTHTHTHTHTLSLTHTLTHTHTHTHTHTTHTHTHTHTESYIRAMGLKKRLLRKERFLVSVLGDILLACVLGGSDGVVNSLLPSIAQVPWLFLLPVPTFFTMEDGDSEFAKFAGPTFKAF